MFISEKAQSSHLCTVRLHLCLGAAVPVRSERAGEQAWESGRPHWQPQHLLSSRYSSPSLRAEKLFHCREIRTRTFQHKLARLSEDFLLVLTGIAAVPLLDYWNSTSKAGTAAVLNVLGQMLIANTACNVLGLKWQN